MWLSQGFPREAALTSALLQTAPYCSDCLHLRQRVSQALSVGGWLNQACLVLTCCCLNLVAVLPLLWLHHVSFSCGCSLVAFLQTTHHTQGRDTSSSLSFPSYVSFSENKLLNWCLRIKLKQRAILKEPLPKLSNLFECHGATKKIMDYIQRFNVAFGFLAKVKDCWTLRFQFRQTMIVTGVNSVLSWSECRVSYEQRAPQLYYAPTNHRFT